MSHVMDKTTRTRIENSTGTDWGFDNGWTVWWEMEARTGMCNQVLAIVDPSGNVIRGSMPSLKRRNQ